MPRGGGCPPPGSCAPGGFWSAASPVSWWGWSSRCGLWRWRARQAAAGGAEIDDARRRPGNCRSPPTCWPPVSRRARGLSSRPRRSARPWAVPSGSGWRAAAAEVRLGGEPAEAWRRLAALPGAGPLARLLERADESGLPGAGPVARLAADARADWARAATARARRAAVLVTAPVGLCFLPAFIAVGVLPVVIGLAGGVLGGGGG